ncbi:temptin [Magallana gigas]|uniref:temptin n=1 Tax=Magallana gigas TaxID=29159 RepID=UPI00334283E6
MRGIVFTVLGLLPLVCGHPYYRDYIPNGYAVFNPCGASYWQAVGHYDPNHHTVMKNPFGVALSNNNHVWNEALCRADSDGDGKTNGEELGDPNCVFTLGSTPSQASSGHPGICEPIGSGPCANVAFRCGCHGNACTG